MYSLGFASITFVCTLGCALIGTALRTAISPAHLSKESQDVIRLGMRLVATMTALPLGLVTAAAKGAFDSQDLAVKNAAAGILTLDPLAVDDFASFGLSAPRNATLMTVFVISSLSLGAAVFLILELDGPFEGIIKISNEPIRFARTHLGQE
jgi:hypothetical protein